MPPHPLFNFGKKHFVKINLNLMVFIQEIIHVK